MNSLTASEFIQNLIVATPLDPQEKARLENPYRWPYGVFDLELGDAFTGNFAVTEDNLWQVFYFADGELDHAVCLAPPGAEGFEILKCAYSENIPGLSSREFVFAINLKALRQAAHSLSQKDTETSLGKRMLLPFHVSKKYVVAASHTDQMLSEVIVAYTPNEAIEIFKKKNPDALVLSCGNVSDIHHAMNVLNNVLNGRDVLAVHADYDRVDQKPQQWLYRLQNPLFNENYLRTREEDYNESTQGQP